MTAVISAPNLSMLPSHSKRKGADDNNPSLTAAKRQKKDAKLDSTSNKRKLAKLELGLHMIPGARPFTPQTVPSHPAPSAPATSTSDYPSKKFKGNSSQPSRAATPPQEDVSVVDPEVESDVRAMDDEADSLRQTSRVPTSFNDSSVPPSGLPFTPSKRSHTTPHSSATATVNGKGKGKGKGNANETIVDMSVPLPANDTPQIHRNKQLRANAMAQYDSRHAFSIPVAGDPGTIESSGGGRRRSSVGRGKRLSTSFENTGVIAQPHNAVSNASFYKHIDSDIPVPDRLRQLLIWCASRAASSYQGTSGATSSSGSSSASLPPLSAAAASTFNKTQSGGVRKLAERRVDLNTYQSDSETSSQPQTENPQNVTNRKWEVTYTAQIEQFAAEEDAWKKTTYAYETYSRNVREAIEKRRAAYVAAIASSQSPEVDPSQDGQVEQPRSEKAKGKQKEDLEKWWSPREHELSPYFQAGASLARSLLGRGGPVNHEEGIAGPSARSLPDPGGTRSAEAIEAELVKRIAEVDYKVDFVNFRAANLLTTVETAREMLDAQFAMIRRTLDARGGAPVSRSGAGGAAADTDVLTTYVRGTRDGGGVGVGAGHDHDPMELVRALARVDAERPPGKIGDAARRAAREVQRVEESGGVGVVGERRFTPATPRKMPGTPRRGNTPARDRER